MRLCVVIPAYRSEDTIEKVVRGLPGMVEHIVVVDDGSPDRMRQLLQGLKSADDRVHIISHEINTGVGGAVLDGYRLAYDLGAEIVVKIDSDDQMDPAHIAALIRPIVEGAADFTKGNRFLHNRELSAMPTRRRIGNIGLSFLTKAASGYWGVFDPTNGYTAIHRSVIPMLLNGLIHKRYFFETSQLLELGLARAVVKDVFIPAKYGGERSSLSELDALFRFPVLLVRGFWRRMWMQYFVRDFTSVSLMLVVGSVLSVFGLIFGLFHWWESYATGIPATTGTVMVATLPLILGAQLLLQAAVLDIQNAPTEPISERAD